MRPLLRSFLNFILLLVAAVALLTCIIGCCFVGALIYVRLTEGHLSGADMHMSRGAGKVAVCGGVVAYCAYWLSRRYVDPKPHPTKSSRLTPPTRRQPRWLPYFNLLTYGGGLGCWFWALTPDGPLHGLEVAAWLTVIFLGLHGRILAHELGHLMVAWAVRMKPLKLQLGTGPMLFAGRLSGGMRWEWRLWPGGGKVETFYGREEGHRWRYWLTVLGGQAANVLLLLLAASWLVDWTAPVHLRSIDGPGKLMLLSLGIRTAILTIFNLLPRRVRLGDAVLQSDGMQLLTLWRLPQSKVVDRILLTSARRIDMLCLDGRREQAWELQRELAARYPQREMFHDAVAGVLHRQDKNFSEAAACYERALTRANLPPKAVVHLKIYAAASWLQEGQDARARKFCEDALAGASAAERVDLLDGFASLPVITGSNQLLAQAVQWSEEALRLAPGKMTVLGTRGSLLVEEDRLDDAEKMLRRVCSRGPTERDRGICWFYRALVARRRGQSERKVQRLCRRAEWMCREPWLLERIYKLLDINRLSGVARSGVPRPAI